MHHKFPTHALPALVLLAMALPTQAVTWEQHLADADAYRRAGDFASAQAALRSALQEAGPASARDPLLPITWHLMGSVHHDLGRYPDAESWYRKAIASFEKDTGPGHVRLPFALRDLGTLYFDARQYARAERVHRRVLNILTELYGPEHIEVAHTLNNLAAVAYVRKRNREAEKLLMQAMAVLEKNGVEDEDMAYVLDNLGVLETAMGAYPEALQHGLRANAILDRLYVPGHPAHISAWTNTAHLYAHTGRTAEGLSLVDRALDSARRIFGEDHPRTAAVLAIRAEVLRAAGDKQQARQVERAARAIFRSHAGIRAMDQCVDVGDFVDPAGAARRH